MGFFQPNPQQWVKKNSTQPNPLQWFDPTQRNQVRSMSWIIFFNYYFLKKKLLLLLLLLLNWALEQPHHI